MYILKYFFGVFLITLLNLTSCSSIHNMNKFTENPNIMDPDLSYFEDGEYLGVYNSGMVTAEVKIETKFNEYYNIMLMKHETLFGKKAEKLIEEVIEKQTLQVDVISGATVSSLTILKAIEVAFK